LSSRASGTSGRSTVIGTSSSHWLAEIFVSNINLPVSAGSNSGSLFDSSEVKMEDISENLDIRKYTSSYLALEHQYLSPPRLSEVVRLGAVASLAELLLSEGHHPLKRLGEQGWKMQKEQ
jgi:hypothetical protein